MMRMILLAILALNLNGCATSYHKAGFMGMGYQDTQLQEDEFQVSFGGNVKLSQAKAREYALRRAAELTTEHGFDYFVITNEGSFSKHVISGSAYSGSGSVVGGSKPEAIVSIKCGKGTKPEGVAGAYDAREFLKYATKQRGQSPVGTGLRGRGG